jgi:hypothetical protein
MSVYLSLLIIRLKGQWIIDVYEKLSLQFVFVLLYSYVCLFVSDHNIDLVLWQYY